MMEEIKNTKQFYISKAFGTEIPSDWEFDQLIIKY